MHKKMSYGILNIGLTVGLAFVISTGIANAQQPARNTPTPADLYCSGIVTDQPVPNDSYLISGENSQYKSTFTAGDYVYINRGAENGVRVGSEFEVVRPIKDAMATTVWFKFQAMLNKAMGTTYADIGRLRVLHVDAKTSTAEMELPCDAMQRGDLVRPFAARPAPQFHDVKLDLFAAPSGKKTAMVVTSKDFAVVIGTGRIVYVNLGSGQGVRVGDYFRVFRYQGTHIETAYQVQDMAYKTFGYGSTPVAYEWNNLPRQVLGEGIVLRTGPNSSTVLLTTAREEIYVGDYVEVE
ncbi:MAG TPA: hypothetical protein VKS00_02285 [Candidatus Acidoferrales bacterium]|nr:hypothetical protein [Candidatus Acidoferrales bacterium]